jgi:hypothetical protein
MFVVEQWMLWGWTNDAYSRQLLLHSQSLFSFIWDVVGGFTHHCFLLLSTLAQCRCIFFRHLDTSTNSKMGMKDDDADL